MTEDKIESTPIPSLLDRMLSVMTSVGAIPKNGHNDFHNYDYVKESDVAEGVRERCIEAGLLIFTCIHNVEREPMPDGKRFMTSIEMGITVVCPETKETQIFHWRGAGEDPSDKGLQKAITNGLKYWMLKTFLIGSDGDDAELSNDRDTASATPKKKDVDFDAQEVKARHVAAVERLKKRNSASAAPNIPPGQTSVREPEEQRPVRNDVIGTEVDTSALGGVTVTNVRKLRDSDELDENKKPTWTLYLVVFSDGVETKTFDGDAAVTAMNIMKTGEEVRYETKPNKKNADQLDLVSVGIAGTF